MYGLSHFTCPQLTSESDKLNWLMQGLIHTFLPFSCNNLESYKDSNLKYSKELCCTSDFWKESSTILMCQTTLLPPVQPQNPRPQLCNVIHYSAVAHSCIIVLAERHVQNSCFLFSVSHILPLYLSWMYEFGPQAYVQ